MRSKLTYLLIMGLFSLSLFGQGRGKIIFKLKEEYRFQAKSNSTAVAELEKLFKEEGVQIKKVFPNHSPISQKSLGEGKVDISSIYSIEVTDEKEKQYLLKQLKKNQKIAYAEEEVVNHLTYQPNDSLNYLQWYLDAVRAFDAWDMEQGDTSVFIAITDTGSDTDHPDLEDNLYKNFDDPINGLDDDNDGFVDNYFGWDVAMNDNDVNPEVHAGSSHGTNVAGIASAVTDNSLGVSGCGFNCRLMTVKIDNPAGQLIGAYSGVVYAADQGAKIINCSWGSYSFSEFGRDIIDYAAINRGALVICGAGNGPFSGPGAGTGIEDRFYPAAYENAMAVGAIDTGDLVKLSSNYGYWLNIFAPGERMWTTTGNGNFGRNGGTSMAAPVVAAAASLVLSQNPGYSNRQIEERLINSAINIDGANISKYAGKLGPGKVDFLNALADTNKPGIRFESLSFNNGIDQVILSGDSLFISGEFVNYLKNAPQGTATLMEMTNSVSNVRSQISLPAINSLDRFNNSQEPFVFVVDPSAPLNSRLEFRLTVNAGSYSKVQHFSILVNNDFLSLRNDQIALTVGSNGSIGYTGPNSDRGIGFRYQNGSSQLWESSFMIGNSINYVADAFRGVSSIDQDFTSLSLMREGTDPRAAVVASGIFNDAALSGNPKIEIQQNNYLYDSSYTERAVIFNYLVKNVSGASMTDLFAGIIADWDVVNFGNNKVFYDDNYKMGVSFSTDSSLYFGMCVLSHPNSTNHYALDNVSGGLGGVDPTGGFSTEEKFQVLSGRRDSAGWHNQQGGDIIDAISIGPFSLAVDSSISLSFAWLVGNSLSELREAADSARAIFEKLPILEEEKISAKIKLYPNPASDRLYVQLKEVNEKNLSIQIFDLNGRQVLERKIQDPNPSANELEIDLTSLKSGLYLLKIIGEQTNIQDKFVLSPNN